MCWGQRVCSKSLYLTRSLAVNQKQLLKKQSQLLHCYAEHKDEIEKTRA